MAGNYEEEYLSITHLDDLQKIIASVADKSYQFGQALKIGQTALDEMKSNKLDKSSELLEVLSHYLNGTTQVPHPSKAHMVTALRAIGHVKEADALEDYPILSTSGEPQSHRLPETHGGTDAKIQMKQLSFERPRPHIVKKLKYPRGLAVIGDTTYIADSGGDNNEGACVMRVCGDTNKVYSVIQDPYGVAIDEDENVYVTDCSSHLLYKFDNKLDVIKVVGNPRGGWNKYEFYYPHGIGVIHDMVYVCDNGSCRVKVYDQDLKFQYTFGDEKQESFYEQPLYGPVDIVGDTKDGLYVADNKKMAIVKFRLSSNTPPGFVRNIRHDNLKMPSGLTIDSSGNIFVTDNVTNRIIVFNPMGTLLTEFVNDLMQAPHGICCVKNCSVLYVSDTDNRTKVNVWMCSIQY